METLITLQRLSLSHCLERLERADRPLPEKIILPNPNGGYFAHGDFLGD
jgi:hypothetical protein